MTTSTTSIASAGEGEALPPVATRPERLYKFIHDVVATPQYAKERHLLVGNCKPNTTLMVYSTDLDQTPLYVFKVVPDVDKAVLQDEVIFLTSTQAPNRLTMVSTFFSSSSNIDGSIDTKVNPVIQEIEMPEDEEVLSLHSSPPLVGPEEENGYSGQCSPMGRPGRGREEEEDDNDEEEVELPSHTWPHGCLIVTSHALYVCQPRMSVESLFMNLVLKVGDIDSANKLGAIFSLDPKLFELAADVKLKSRNFSAAIALYKHSRCPHVKCSIKFAAQGLVTEFLTYMGTLTSGVSGPDLGAEERRNLANLAIICHLHHLCLPGSHKPPPQQQALRNLLLFLRDNQYYDEVLALSLAAGAWRWETLQYLAASRGLYLEKLRLLLTSQSSPVLDTLSSEQLAGTGRGEGLLSVAREREAGYLHCVSDPELRQVLLVRPSLARTHIALVLSLLGAVDLSVLRRLADLYNPTHPAIRPFLQATNGRKQAFPPLSSVVQSSCLLPGGAEELVSLETFIEVFLAIIIQLNLSRGWCYRPALLTYKLELPKERVPVPLDKVRCQVLSCGYGHTAVIIGGALYTWGLSDYGVLGHGPRSNTSPKLLTGMGITLLEDQEPLLTGPLAGGPALAPLLNGRVLPSVVSDGTEPKLVSYLSQTRVLSVACGKNHMLAITDNGVYGWGSNKYGQVGVGGTGRCPRPTLVSALEGKGIVSVACGQFHSLCVSDDGTLYSWGWGVHGQLGNDSVEDVHQPSTVTLLAKKHIVQADGGYAHSVAMSQDGNVYAWGCGTYGQIGNGGIVKVCRPVRVHLPGPATHLTAGYFQNIAVTRSHKVYMWGNNPACLRVQAQLQRRARSCQQAAEAGRRASGGGEARPGGQGAGGEREVASEGSTPSGSPGEGASVDVNGASDSFESGEEAMAAPSPPANPSTTLDDSEDTITTLPEEEQQKDREGDSAKSFVISPDPSPEKLAGHVGEVRGEGEAPGTPSEATDTASSTTSPQDSPGDGGDATVVNSPVTNGNMSGMPRTVSANTVPSCDPTDLGHLLPQEVEMPHGFGAVRAVACGSQHCLLLTTHGALYSWGRNMSGQLGTGNRREVTNPVRIMDDAYITDVACGADFTLALESQGQLWAWGSNFYSQLGKSGAVDDDKGQAGRVFMLRTTKRVLKVPHSVHSNCETPRPVTGLPPNPGPPPPHYGISSNTQEKQVRDGSHWWLGRLPMEDVEELEEDKKAHTDEQDDGLYGIRTLHSALTFFHSCYNSKNVTTMLQDAEAHQALATLYTLERQYSQAMHHHLCALFKQGKDLYRLTATTTTTTASQQEGNTNSEGTMERQGKESASSSQEQDKCSADYPSKMLVDEAVRIIDYYLRLQTEESQTGMRHVLQEGISLWLSHALPLGQLEELLLTHLPRTVYPLALLLFGDGASGEVEEGQEKVPAGEAGGSDPAVQVLGQLSTKFCLNLCTSVISHLQAGGGGSEYVDALARISGVQPGSEGSQEGRTASFDETSKLDQALDALSKKATNTINLKQEDVASLQKSEAAHTRKRTDSRGSISGSHKLKAASKGSKEQDKDCVLFTCGHHFTRKEFLSQVLPQMETSVMTVPGLLGNTARVLLDQYHSDQPEMACPHCVLAHLTIKLTKHKQAQ
ncbi:Ultraviolet-B receptor UVR8 [Portunus trituberculatus]|uniref:Ultraviolet-B receptor UVR8 n=1 Tax=Portunus trituberculatus TaxID=210409 RepID=A0A5B7CQV5_PORTR|nr:Ultraviolet-B receptor UVR8 [Portunus trituberculatus]